MLPRKYSDTTINVIKYMQNKQHLGTLTHGILTSVLLHQLIKCEKMNSTYSLGQTVLK